MKNFLVILMVVAMASFLFVGCLPGVTPDVDEDVVVTLAAIPGVTAPVTGATPVTAITATAQYTGVVTWLPVATTFAAATAYTATITLTPATGFTLTGVAANFFTVAGATTDTNPADSGVVTAVFPATAAAEVPTSATPVITAVRNAADTLLIVDVTSTSTQYINDTEAGTSILVKGTAPSESLVTIYIDDVAVVGAVGETATTGLWSVAIAESSLGDDGTKVMTAKATEVGLAESAASNSATFILDTVDPGFSIAATAAVAGGTAAPGTTASAIVQGSNPVDVITINSSTTIAMVAGTWTISTWGVSAALGNVTITSSTYSGTKTYQVTDGDIFTNVIPGVTFTFITLAPGNSATITTTASVLASTTAIAGRATITFDEDVTAAGMALGVYTTLGDPTTYKTATDTGYWNSTTTAALAPGLAGVTYTISAYGFTDLAGNPGGTLASPITDSCVVGVASQVLAP